MITLPKFYIEKPKVDKKLFSFSEKESKKMFFDRVEEFEKWYLLGFSSIKEYLYWDKLKYKLEKMFKNKSKPEIYWTYIKQVRKIKSKKTPIKSINGNYFTYNNLPGLDKLLHEIDLDLGGEFSLTRDFSDKEKKNIFLSSLSEEAIASAQLEGAHSSREAAIMLIKEKRKPKDKSEIMILNNYNAMMKLESDFLGKKDVKINIDTLLDFHKILTSNAIEDNNLDAVGRLRNKDEHIHVCDDRYIYHESLDMIFVKKELNKLIDFINDDEKYDFIHPIIKAIMIHFWLGYLHPFYDGNGRMARLLFYLYLLKHDYSFFAYYPISIVIKKSQKKYSMSYVYSEQDDEDLTYFIDYNIRKINEARISFEKYLQKFLKEKEENSEKYKQLELFYGLNDRQISLLRYLSKSSGNMMTLSIYKDNNKISKSTAIKDLKILKKIKLLEWKKIGREVKYYISKPSRENIF
jgi:Fic family protein